LGVRSSRMAKRRETGAATSFPSGDPEGGANLVCVLGIPPSRLFAWEEE
jgi:hypothetical protein